ncbi:hypothetical protein [Flagellimonas sp. 2504JD1-5]
MKKIFFLVLFACLSSNAQVSFSKGEIIKVNGEKIKCFVGHFSKTNVLSSIVYKIEQKGETIKLDASDVQEIILREKKHFLILNVDIDNRSNEMSKLQFLDRNGDFNFQKKHIALELLVDGTVPLYKTTLDRVKKFFYKNHSGKIKQLLYKRYFLMRSPNYFGNDFVNENNFYYRQLYSEVPCYNKRMEFKPPAFEELKLVAYFKKYNSGKCSK